jgi:lipopolysaccharide export system permease protein
LAVTAEHGQFLATDDPDTIILRLQKGVLVHDAPSFKEPRVLQFVGHDLPIDLPKMEAFRQRGGRDLEMTMPELVVTAHQPQTPAKQRAQFRSEFHFRLVEVATMFLLPMLALALAVPPKRSSSALGVFLSIVMIVTQHKINEYAASVAALGRIDPLIALWVPFLLFAALVWWMYRTIAFVPGGQPIGALERAADKAAKAVTGWIRRVGGKGRA